MLIADKSETDRTRKYQRRVLARSSTERDINKRFLRFKTLICTSAQPSAPCLLAVKILTYERASIVRINVQYSYGDFTRRVLWI